MAAPRSTRCALLSVLTATTIVASGCASLGLGSIDQSTAAFVDIDGPALQAFPVAAMTDMERDVRLETGRRDIEHEKLTPALFWTGIGVGTVASAGAIAFGVAGFVTKNQLSDGFDGEGLTLDERDSLVSRGETFNGLTVALTTVAVISYALAIVAYGVDWNRCGPLVRKSKKRNCEAAGYVSE